MPKESVFSSPDSIKTMKACLRAYLRLPFASDTIPGAVLEHILASVRNATVLHTYDFVDVLKESSAMGWQVKCTLERTPVTWKRAKIPNSSELIERSLKDSKSCKLLGDTIIDFCNQIGHDSLQKYRLESIGYARLIIHRNRTATYFEKELITKDKCDLFDANQFSWKWSDQKLGRRKEQLNALHGIHVPTGRKWFVWHGKGENQLHFDGERSWWPKSDESNWIKFSLPSANEKLNMREFILLLSN